MVERGTSMDEVRTIIKDLTSNLGSTEVGNAGYAVQQNKQIASGMEALKNA